MNSSQDYAGMANPRVRLRIMLAAWAALLLTGPVMYVQGDIRALQVIWFVLAAGATGIPPHVELYYACEVLRQRHPEEWASLGLAENPWTAEWGLAWSPGRSRAHRYVVWSGGHPDELIRGACLNVWLSHLAMAALIIAMVNSPGIAAR